MFDWFNDPTKAAPAVTPPSVNGGGYAGYSAFNAPGSFVSDPSAWATNGANQFGGNNLGGGVNLNGGNNNTGGLGFNSNTVGMVIGGIQALGSMWSSYQQQKLAKKSFKLQEEAYRTNLANQTKTYNTALEDRIRARHFTEGKESGATDDYLSKHSL